MGSEILPINLKSSVHNYFGDTIKIVVKSFSQNILDFLKITWTKH